MFEIYTLCLSRMVERWDKYLIRKMGAMVAEGGRKALRRNTNEIYIEAHIINARIDIWDCSQEPENGGEAGQIPNKENGRDSGQGGREALRSNTDEI